MGNSQSNRINDELSADDGPVSQQLQRDLEPRSLYLHRQQIESQTSEIAKSQSSQGNQNNL